jgi:protein-tyrosine phosphatase
VDVTLPDGTRIRALSLRERRAEDSERDFGLYLDPGWEPTWPAELIDWQDFGTPADWDRAAAQIESAFTRARAGQLVEIGCRAGLGRTGTVLACMAVLAGVPGPEAVGWVKKNYRPGACETDEQQAWVLWFAARRAREPTD